MQRKRSYIRVIAFIALLTICFQVPCDRTVYAITKENRTAHIELKKTLKKMKAQFCDDEFNKTLPYVFKDVDGDKIDELLIMPGFGYYTEGIFDYKNGKVVEAATVGQGEFTTFYTTNKVIYIHNSGHMGVLYDYYYKQNTKTNKYTCVAYVEKEYAQDDYEYAKAPVKVTYYKRDKVVTKTEYTKYVKALKKNSKIMRGSKIKWSEY